MSSVIVTPPTQLPVSVGEVKTTGRITYSDMDADIDEWIRAATDLAQSLTGGRQLTTATWRDYFNGFYAPSHSYYWGTGYCSELRLGRSPVIAVSAVEYIDTEGITQTLPDTAYRVDNTHSIGRVVLLPGQTWPSTWYGHDQSVSVVYTAGYGPEPADIPRLIRRSIIARVLAHNEFRESLLERSAQPMPREYADGLLDPYVVRTF